MPETPDGGFVLDEKRGEDQARYRLPPLTKRELDEIRASGVPEEEIRKLVERRSRDVRP